MDDTQKILEAVGKVRVETAAIRGEHGARLLAIEGHLQASNGALNACVATVGDHDTRIALVEAVQTSIMKEWTDQQVNCKTHADRTTKLENNLIKLAFIVPIFSFIGGGVVRLAEVLGLY